MKKAFECPELIIILFEDNDIIVTSGDKDEETNGDIGDF